MTRLNDKILEDFITQHRKALEVFEPPAEMWQRIAEELDNDAPIALDEEEDGSDMHTLETFISQNQSDLDLFEPPTEAWQRIAGALDNVSTERDQEDAQLEGFVMERQDEFDVFEPSLEVWQKIAEEISDPVLTEPTQSSPSHHQTTTDELLEQFVTKTRDEFNMFEPPAEIWQQVSGALDNDYTGKVITLSYRSIWKIASAAAVILLVGFIGVKFWGGQTPASTHDNMATTEDSTILKNTLADDFNLKELDPELAEAESYYTELIAEKKKELDKYSLEDVTLKEEFKGDISELDSTYNALRKELYNVPSKDKVSEAMILNLQTRIEILNQQLKILEKAKKKTKGKKNEKMDI
ncbi:hypothetical protein [Microscilla marina]|uniref:Uncharacterized protein n=1 Tax=Microscilla marina ATCC 23134 TaxID=313606 RepID=A1ZLZ2_MICM2|nr:hypothetical protein [Microscilla marina]EAY28524.1 hypothetical protein M23134_04371 [Microscilla marina ATCC 23134]